MSRPDIEPGPAAWQARMLPPAPQRWTCRVGGRGIDTDYVIVFKETTLGIVGLDIAPSDTFYLSDLKVTWRKCGLRITMQ